MLLQNQVISVILLVLTFVRGEQYSDSTKYDNFDSQNYLETEKHIRTKNNSKVIAQTGGRALLPCEVKLTPPATVSWIRLEDFQLLTVGLSTYSSDERYQIEHGRHMGNWPLSIKGVGRRDEGLYKCQLSVHPVESILVELIIIEAVSEISGAPDLHIDVGSTLRLECKLKSATELPSFVFWFHGDKMVNYDSSNGFSVTDYTYSEGDEMNSIETIMLPITVLTIRNVNFRHAGNYSCAPANARISSIIVHVLKDDKPAAMQHSNSSTIDGTGTSASNCIHKLLRLTILFCLLQFRTIFVFLD